MRSFPLVSFVALLLGSSVACDDGGGGSIPFDQLANRLAAASCESIFRCCDAAERMQQFQIFNPAPTTVAECTTTLAAFYQSLVLGDESITSGRVAYDGEAAADCLAAVNGAACGAATEAAQDGGACAEFLYGTVPLAGMCKGDDECATDGAFCDGGTDDTFGACTALPAVGQPCPDFQCVDGAYCDFGTSMCAALKANGTTCDGDDECTSDNCDITCMPAVVDMTCDGV